MLANFSGTEESNLDPFLAINPANASLVYQPWDLVPENESQVPPPDDYLESSTRLLQSLAEEETFIAGDEKLLEGVLTPLSITSMLMLLVAGTSGRFGCSHFLEARTSSF